MGKKFRIIKDSNSGQLVSIPMPYPFDHGAYILENNGKQVSKLDKKKQNLRDGHFFTIMSNGNTKDVKSENEIYHEINLLSKRLILRNN